MVEVAALEEDVLEWFTQLVVGGHTLRGIRERAVVKEYELPVDDAPLIRLMFQILDNHTEV